MYSDYVNYVKNIRNSLIQNGIEVSDVNDDLNDYRVLFLLGLKLDEVLYYFHVLAVSGSEYMLKDFFLPLNDTYKDRLRNICYDEFITDILPNYKKLLGDDSISDYYEYEDSDEDIENEDSDLYSDMFDEDINDNQENTKDNSLDNVENNSYAIKSFLDVVSSIPENKKYEEVPHGIILDALNEVVEPIIKESEMSGSVNSIYEEVSHGVNLDELIKENGVSDRVKSSEYEEVPHGINLDELIEETTQEDNFSWESEEPEDEGSWGDEEESYDEVEPEEEGSWGDEEVEESEWGEDEEEYEEPEEESPWEEDEVEEGSWGDEEVEESEWEEDEVEEGSWGDDEEEYEEEISLEEDISENTVNEESNVNTSNKGNKVVKKDLADNLQELTNKTLTGIKKGMIRLINKENSN